MIKNDLRSSHKQYELNSEPSYLLVRMYTMKQKIGKS